MSAVYWLTMLLAGKWAVGEGRGLWAGVVSEGASAAKGAGAACNGGLGGPQW